MQTKDNRNVGQSERETVKCVDIKGNVLIIPFFESIFIIILVFFGMVILIWTANAKLDRLERRIDAKFECYEMDNRRQDLRLSSFEKKLYGITELTVHMWGDYFKKNKENGKETETTK